MKSLIQIGNRTVFVQWNIYPSSVPKWAGNYMEVGGISNPQGDLTVIEAPDPAHVNQWIRAGVTRGEKGLASGDLTITTSASVVKKMSKAAESGMATNMFVLARDRGRADAFNIECIYKILYENVYMTAMNEPVAAAQSGGSNGAALVTIPVSALDVLYMFPMFFGQVGAAETTQEVIDGTFFYPPYSYYQNENQFYALVIDSDGATAAPQILITDDQYNVLSAVNVTPIAGTASPLALETMYSSFVVAEAAATEYHYAPIADILDGVGTSWESSATLAAAITAIKVADNLLWIGLTNGDIYNTENPAFTPEIALDGVASTAIVSIDTFGEMVVALTTDAKIVLSQDGRSGELLTVDVDGSPIVGTGKVVSIINESTWLVAIGGDIYYTSNQGRSYEKANTPASITAIQDIKMIGSVGYAIGNTAGTPIVLRTESMGAVWNYTDDKSKWVDGMVATATGARFVAMHPDRHTVIIGGGTAAAGWAMYASKD